MKTRLRLPAPVRRYLLVWAVNGHPDEVCGLLVGRRDGTSFDVVRASLSRNLETGRARDRYILAPDDFVAEESRARQDGLDVIGIWHTHPDHPAEPSATDLASAWEEYAYLIVSVTSEGVVDLRSWQLRRGSFEEQIVEENETWAEL